MKTVLIISPHFPPINAPDMQRLRQSLPFFFENGWEAEVITVNKDCIEINSLDNLLLENIPKNIKIHTIQAWDINKTRKFGLGSLSMRSFFHFKKAGNKILGNKKFDLVFFSTTAFHVMALGNYWKRKYGIPFIVDMQDPWRNDFYLDKPLSERPPKFFITYNIDKFLEAKTIPFADGIISVSSEYINVFHQRYPSTKKTKSLILPFAGNKIDFEISNNNSTFEKSVELDKSKKNIIYIGRGGIDLKKSTGIFFAALKEIAKEKSLLYAQIHCWFIGTSYALSGKGLKTILPIAESYGVEAIVTEITDRLPYFETLYYLQQADLLFIPGSTDTAYTASKIYPYILAKKSLLAIFHKKSSVVNIINETNAGTIITFDEDENILKQIAECKENLLKQLFTDRELNTNWLEFEKYTAKSMTKKMLSFFDEIIS